MLEKLFALKAHGVTARGEIVAGVTVFFTMAYILFVNPPSCRPTGMDSGAVFMATAIAAAATTALMGLYANLPIALAPGMGQNAYFAFTVVPLLAGDWRLALGCVFLSGILFVALSLSPACANALVTANPAKPEARHWRRHRILPGPDRLRGRRLRGRQQGHAAAAGQPGLIPGADRGGRVLLIAALWARKVPGAVLIGIAAATLPASH